MKIIACIDNATFADEVCDYAAWAAHQTALPVTLLHVLDRDRFPIAGDLSGYIGLGSREHLLAELTNLDEQRAKLALENGMSVLKYAQQRIVLTGQEAPQTRQQHGHLIDTLKELQPEASLIVMGWGHEVNDAGTRALGSQLESIIRTLHCPILVASFAFKQPQRVMLAFDGSPAALETAKRLAGSSLCKSLPIHVVMVGTDSVERSAQLESARLTLTEAGCTVNVATMEGDVETALHDYLAKNAIDLLVMGAYGRSRLRQLLAGSITTHLLATSNIPLLILH